ncbi:MAG: hypothetical protein PHH08_04650 [Candidatus ainarchaeum sp.]|nr:hypothetical protein [Candidatus ainarchaeum sp.]
MAIEHFKRKEWLSPSDYVLVIVDFDNESKKVIGFCVAQVYVFGETEREVIRFDSAHDFVHVHRYYQRAKHEGEALQREISSETAKEFKRQILNDWQKYKQWFLLKRQNKDI